ncbi:flagellar hook protein FlgE [Phenylobacterium sp.]|uniref:flagellar hook protein FlgE n=1 Tax=Phenylobacterium sp. TaxID=1871053 RepID=UPI003569BA80
MSINSALLAGVSGLVANSSALAAISDNIANVNTTAYKRNQVDFATMVTSQAVKGEYSAGGVQGSSKAFVSQQGLIQSSSSSTSLAISGDGFFVVSTKGAGLTASDPREFTRAGAFAPDANGYLVNDAGLYLQGWPVNATGGFTTDPSDLSKIGPINVKNLGAAVQQTSTLGISANLDQTTAVSAGAATYNKATKSMAAFAATGTGTAPDAPPMELSVVDSMGGTHKFALAFEKTATPNTWNAEIYAVPASDVSTAGPNGQIAAGLVKFNTDGSIDLANSTLFGAAGAPPQINLAASGGAQPAWGTALGIAAQPLTLDLSQFTQLAAATTVNSVTSNGAGVGNIVGVQVSPDGVVSALFDNSQVRKIAQIAIATFPNADGLQAVNGNAYTSTLPAGQMTLKAAGVGGAGKIAPSSLEASTVDLSTEFTGLITTQKAYSASSKIITTADTMLDELINIIR